MARCRVVGVVDDLDPLCAGAGEQVETGGEYVAGESALLVVVSAVVDHEVLVGTVERLRVLAAIESMDKPSIATLYGYCLDGGLELPLACHFRLAAAEGARIGLPELDLGTVPAWGGTARLTRCVGHPSRCFESIRRTMNRWRPEATIEDKLPSGSLSRMFSPACLRGPCEVRVTSRRA